MSLRRRELLELIDLSDRLLDIADPAGLGPVLLAGLARLSGADSAVWHEIDVRDPLRKVVVGWPPDRFTAGFAQQAAAVVHTHPLLVMSRRLVSSGRRLPATSRLSTYVSAREWRGTPLYRDAWSYVDDQMVMNLSVHGSVLRCVSVERSGGTFCDRDLEVFTRVARPVRAALRRVGAVAALQIAPYAAWTVLDPDGVASDPFPLDRLTVRQRQVLVLVGEGLTDAQIGRRLATSTRTVSKHLQNAYSALGVSNRVAALQMLRGS